MVNAIRAVAALFLFFALFGAAMAPVQAQQFESAILAPSVQEVTSAAPAATRIGLIDDGATIGTGFYYEVRLTSGSIDTAGSMSIGSSNITSSGLDLSAATFNTDDGTTVRAGPNFDRESGLANTTTDRSFLGTGTTNTSATAEALVF